MDPVIAVDIVIFFNDKTNQKLIELSQSINNSNLILNNINRPHLSICKLLIKQSNISKITSFKLNNFPILSIDFIKEGEEKNKETSAVIIKNSLHLDNFRKEVINFIAPFSESSFDNILFSEEVNDLTKYWVEKAINKKCKIFNPHVSLGFGKLTKNLDFKELIPESICLVHMGNFCTSKLVLKRLFN